jgi:hypothetical protein
MLTYFYYVVMSAMQEAISQKIRKKRNELQQAKATVGADVVSMRQLESKVTDVDRSCVQIVCLFHELLVTCC